MQIGNDLKLLIGNSKVILRNEGILDENTFLSYGTDRTKIFSPDFQVLCFPTSTEDVQKIIEYANKNNYCVVPTGGRTGYAGGAIAKNGEIVISLSKMDKVIDFDPFFSTLTVEAGMITKNLHKEAEDRGFYFPVDFAATGSSHIGGNVATNAGGVRVVHYGLTRNWISGLKVVTGKGEILEFNGNILKNNTGLDLKQLFIGSEGTLGVITEVTVRLTQKPTESSVILLGVPTFDAILDIFKTTHSIQLPLLAFEFFTDRCISKVIEHLDLNLPFSSKPEFYTLLEFEIKREDDENELLEFIEKITELELIEDGSIAQNSNQKVTFWKYREGISESLSILHSVHKNDISIPLRNMKEFLQKMETLLNENYPLFEIALFGHIGDGNIHLNILKPKDFSEDEFHRACKIVDPQMFQLIRKYGGSISAEHGIGLLKKEFLHFSRSENEIELMQKIKKTFDPNLILNPGKVF
ncbi:MAG: FAD-binding oxidoreductase [Leptospiraceae bacterium]|nr:FAD-binding oxidoreductase [Leptospiraceae bacterium]